MSIHVASPTEQPASVVDRLDRAGMSASIICAIHCALSPLLLPLVPLMLGRVVGPAFEWSFVAISLILGASSLGHSYRALHRSRLPLAIFVSGFMLLLGGRLLEPAFGIPDLLLVVPAASLIVSAHVLNVRLRKRVVGPGECGCPCHDA